MSSVPMVFASSSVIQEDERRRTRFFSRGGAPKIREKNARRGREHGTTASAQMKLRSFSTRPIPRNPGHHWACKQKSSMMTAQLRSKASSIVFLVNSREPLLLKAENTDSHFLRCIMRIGRRDWALPCAAWYGAEITVPEPRIGQLNFASHHRSNSHDFGYHKIFFNLRPKGSDR